MSDNALLPVDHDPEAQLRAEAISLEEAFDRSLAALSPDHQKFVLAYLKEPVSAIAARAAGYSERSSRSSGPWLLAHPGCKLAIRRGLAWLADAEKVDLRTFVKELQHLAYSDLTELRTDENGEPIKEPGREHLWRAVRKITTTATKNRDGSTATRTVLEGHSKEGVLRMLGQFLGVLAGDAAPVDDTPPPPSVRGVEVKDVVGD